MNNIEELVRLAIEEFKDDAHELVEVSALLNNASPSERFWFSPTQKTFNLIINDEHRPQHIRPKHLPELFAHGVKFYGFEQEVKMWEFYSHPELEWVNFGNCSYDDALKTFDIFGVRRKTSAARPFDLEGSKAGDVVEVLNPDCTWITCKYLYEYTDKRIVMMVGTLSEVVKKEDLRMKYPKKVQS